MRDPLKEPRYGDVFVWNPPTVFGIAAAPRLVMFLIADTEDWIGMVTSSGTIERSWFPLDYNAEHKPDFGYWTVAS